MKKHKIIYQSTISYDKYPASGAQAQAHLDKMAGEGFEITARGINRGVTPMYMYEDMLGVTEMLTNLFKAQEEGFEAAITGCFLDTGLYEAREVLDIPVIGLAESAMMWANIYGRKAAIVTYSKMLPPKTYALNAEKYHQEHLMMPAVCFDVNYDALAKAMTDKDAEREIMEAYDRACHEAVKAGADVILPGCGTLNFLSQKVGYSRVGDTGALVIDSVGCAVKMAEAAIELKEKSAQMTSRAGIYLQPSKESISEVIEAYGLF